jgi:hypothetical protein
MSIELLRQIAARPLPTSFGLVIAVPEEPPEGGIKVVAITEKGNQELLHLHYPGHRQPDPVPRSSWLQVAAQRARSAFREAGRSGRRRF